MILTYYCIITMIIIAYLLGSIPSAVWAAYSGSCPGSWTGCA